MIYYLTRFPAESVDNKDGGRSHAWKELGKRLGEPTLLELGVRGVGKELVIEVGVTRETILES
jgi:hypothetical protein